LKCADIHDNQSNSDGWFWVSGKLLNKENPYSYRKYNFTQIKGIVFLGFDACLIQQLVLEILEKIIDKEGASLSNKNLKLWKSFYLNRCNPSCWEHF